MSNILIAKPIIDNEYWILTNGKEKIGNVVANNSGVELKLNGTTLQYEDIHELSKQNGIKFQSDFKKIKVTPKPIYDKFPVNGKMFNNIVDLKKRIQLYTKTPNSKCYHAAGYFNIKFNGTTWETMFCPKYIYIQRYEYQGPFCSKEECMKNSSHGND